MTVDSVCLLIDEYFNSDLRGVAGKKISIIGCGNIGSKIALYLIEKGAKVFVNRRDQKKIGIIVRALNILKPKNTIEIIKKGSYIKLANNADVLIGAINGKPVIDKKIVSLMKNNSLIIDVGKGTIKPDGMKIARNKKITIFRADIFPALEVLITQKLSINYRIKIFQRFKFIGKIKIISPGSLGNYGDIVVDVVENPKIVYGVCDGRGDFLRKIPKKYKNINDKIEKSFT